VGGLDELRLKLTQSPIWVGAELGNKQPDETGDLTYIPHCYILSRKQNFFNQLYLIKVCCAQTIL